MAINSLFLSERVLKKQNGNYLQELLAYKIEGLIVLSHTIPSQELASFNIPIVTIEREYGSFPDEYRIVGFDDSPIASEAIIPISTVGQQIDKIAFEAMDLLVSQMNERKKRRPTPQTEIIHKKITPILVRRDTTK